MRTGKLSTAHIETLEGRALFSGVAPAVVYPGTPGASNAETATANIVATQLSATTYSYSITLTNTSATPATAANQVGTFWYAWIPGEDFLASAPLSVASPAGWTGQVIHAGAGDGYSIQWVASSNVVPSGGSLSGFTFTSSDAPTQVFGKSTFFPTIDVDTAFVYAGQPEADAGDRLTLTSSTTPVAPVTPTAKQTASATVKAVQIAPAVFQYSITLKNTSHRPAAASNQIGTFWYAWLPHEDFLATAPLSITSPAGWTDKITGGETADGFAIQWVTTSDFVKAGRSLSGFTFTSSDTPAQVFGNSSFFPSTPVNTSVVYSGAPFSDTGFTLDAVGSTPNRAGALLAVLATTPLVTATTVPANGDVNPYGVAFVPRGFAKGGPLAEGDVLVSNFNNSANQQGTGSTLVSITPAGATSVFYQGPAGVGLTTALGVLRSGFVLVGNVPSTDGTSATAGQGSLIVLNKSGTKVAEFTDSTMLNGPWDLAVVDGGSAAKVFVSNVLSGTVTRLDLKISAKKDSVTIAHQTQIASGYAHGGDPAAFELGPTGLVFDAARNELFVASTADNAVYGITAASHRKTDAGKGTLIYSNASVLRGPLALVMAPNGDLIASNGDALNANSTQPSELVEFTLKGQFVAQTSVDSSGQGGAFGIAISAPNGPTIQFAAVDDLTNSLDIWTIKRSALHRH